MANKKIFGSACILSLAIMLAQSVYAQDAVPLPQIDWSGGYAGLSLGLTHSTVDQTGRVKELGYFVNEDPGQLNPILSDNLDSTNLSGSVFGGYNFQMDRFVFGLEAAVSAMNLEQSFSSGDLIYITQPAHTFRIDTQIRSNWMASLRPRLGYAFDRSLFYISGGPAITQLSYKFQFSDTFQPESASASQRKTKLGWTLGAGMEHALTEGWNLRADYSYFHFENIIKGIDSDLAVNAPDGFVNKANFNGHALHMGLLKRF